jgi:hypothetical protein
LAVELLAPVADALVAVIAWVAEVFLALFRSFIRSVRFAFSPSFREAERERLKGQGPFYRVLHASWGAAAAIAFLCLVGALIYWLSRPPPTPAEACAKLELQQLAKCAQSIRYALPN